MSAFDDEIPAQEWQGPYQKLREEVLVCRGDSAAVVGALILIADALHELIEQNRGAGVFRECLLQAIAGIKLNVKA